MEPLLLYQLALGFVAVTALGRFTGIAVLKLRRQGRYAKQAVAYPRSWRDVCTVPEPYLLGATTLLLALRHRVPDPLPAEALARGGAGAAIALVAVVLMLWVLRVFPGVSTGHYVLPDQRVVREGPYGLVRHPLYLAAYLVWLALAIAYASPGTLAITVLYVIPGYAIYMRSEERMLRAHLGDAYRRYQSEVGMLLPRLRRVSANPHKAAALAYAGLGVLVVFVTFSAGLVPRTRADATWQWVVGASFVLILAGLVWRGWWWVAALLVVSNAWRAISYFDHGLGLHVELRTLSITPIEPRPVAFVNAALMAVIVLLLARSAWSGFSAWRARRRIGRES